MNVKLAMQTLSKSVHDALIQLKNSPNLDIDQSFQDCDETAKFCLQFNNMADLLNCKNRYSKQKYLTPLTADNFETLKTYAEDFEKYILTLQLDGKCIVDSERKAGFFWE